MRTRLLSAALWGVLAAGASLYSRPSQAQQSSESQASTQQASTQQASTQGTKPASSGALEEIIVTAERRESTAQKTPISLTAVTGAELEALGTPDISSAIQEAPGIAAISAGPGQVQYEIRGLSNDGGQFPTVGFYVDDVPVSPPPEATAGKVAIDPDLYDLQRVEVLRGPQGTLFGAGSMGGTVRLITNLPDPTAFSAKGQTLVSGTDGGGINYGQNAMVNIPFLDEHAALRLVGTYEHTSGWIDRIVASPFPLEGPPNPYQGLYGLARGNVLATPVVADYSDVNDENLTTGRASLLLKPIERFSIDASVFYQRIAQGGPDYFDSSPGTLAHYEPYDIAEPYSDEFSIFSITMNYQLDWAQLTSVSGYSRRLSSIRQDNSESIQDGLDLPFSVADGGFGPVTAAEDDTTRQITEEARLTSSGDSALQWLAGFFYSHFDSGTTLALPSPAVAPITGGATDSIANINNLYVISQRSEFGNVSYKVTDQIKLTAGLRHFSYSSTNALYSWGLLNTGTGPAGASLQQAAASDSGNNPMFDVSYSPSDQTMLYATASKGFRPGAPNYPIASPSTPEGAACLANLEALGLSSLPVQYGPDSVWNYELGEKSSLFDRTMTLNADAYYIRWSGVQEPVNLPCGERFTTNAANANVEGGEFELNTKLLGNFRFVQSVGYSYAAFANASEAADITKGERLLDVPNWTLNSELQYFHDIGNNTTLVGRLQNSFVSWSTDLTYAVNHVPSRDVASLRLGIEHNQFSAFLSVDNLFNKVNELAFANLLAFDIPAYNPVVMGQPRTIGLYVNYAFGP